MNARKGFVIATDALLALAIVFALVSLAFETVNRSGGTIENEIGLQAFVEQAGLTLKTSQLASRAVILDNTTQLRTYVNAWPTAFCGSISVFSSPDENEATFIVTKSGCSTQNAAVERVRHSFVVPTPPDANMYVMEVAAWPTNI